MVVLEWIGVVRDRGYSKSIEGRRRGPAEVVCREGEEACV